MSDRSSRSPSCSSSSGFITNLNMALVPHLRNIFDLPYAHGHAGASRPSSWPTSCSPAPPSMLIESIGYKRTMVVALFIQVVGCLLFVPAAKLVNFPLFLTAVFVVGAGVDGLADRSQSLRRDPRARAQRAGSPHPGAGPELARRHHRAACVAGAYILTDPAALSDQGRPWPTRCAALHGHCGRLLILGLPVMFLHLPHITQTQEFRPGKEGDPVLSRSIWSYRHTVLAAVESSSTSASKSAWPPSLNYFKTQGVRQPQDRFVPGRPLLGRRAGRPSARLLDAHQVQIRTAARHLRIRGHRCSSLSPCSRTGQVAIWAVVMCGFFNSIMFPNIFALGIAGLGPMTSKGSGLIMTAVVGGAVVPTCSVNLADHDAASSTRSLFPPSATSSSPTTGFGGPSQRGLCKRRLDPLYKLKALRRTPKGLRTLARNSPWLPAASSLGPCFWGFDISWSLTTVFQLRPVPGTPIALSSDLPVNLVCAGAFGEMEVDVVAGQMVAVAAGGIFFDDGLERGFGGGRCAAGEESNVDPGAIGGGLSGEGIGGDDAG